MIFNSAEFLIFYPLVLLYAEKGQKKENENSLMIEVRKKKLQ